ncbi:MAG: DUF3187 family protein [Longimicrobiales bacterium]|nr:DUF3187 family protein [Longimicrobiales bacterium]
MAALALGAAPSALRAQLPTLGPLTAEEAAPLQRLGLTPMVEGAGITPRGVVRADLWAAYGNVWEQDSSAVANVFLDLERLITAATVRVGVVEGLEMGARATLERTAGGFLDDVVMGFHRGVGAGDRNRPAYPRDEYGQWLRDGDGKLLVDIPSRGSLTLEDVRLFAKWGAFASEDGRRTVSVKGEVRIPTAENTLGDERVDAAVLVMGHAPWRGWYLHGFAGASTVRRAPELERVLRASQWLAMVGAERPLRPGLSLVAELTGSTQLLRDVGDHDVDGSLTNVVFGVVGRTGRWRWELSMQEDVPPRGPSTDFMLQAELSRSW